VEKGPGRHGIPLPPSLTDGKPAEIVRLLRSAPAGTFDEALLAGGWTLLTQAALPSLLECQRLGVRVAVAAIFATGLLTDKPNVDPKVGRPTYAYQAAPDEVLERAERWRTLAAEHGVSLPAVAIAFAYLPTCVARVVIGCATAEEVAANVRAIEESAKVPASLWHVARARGLLGEDIPLPAA
jgi:D-threo-aldose 1-dehydrogenase